MKSNAIDSNEFVGDEKKNTKTNSISHSGGGVPHAVQDEWEGNTNQLVQGGGGKDDDDNKQTGVR